jgi:NAD(P)-dependent dehydrogenase (short-subunit alcohol dehydrogenase family)
MAAKSPVALILGAGARIGHHVGSAFAAKGYKIALVARSLKDEDSTPDQMSIRGDFSDPESVVKAFAKAEAQLGLPSVVIYNGRYPFPHPALFFRLTFAKRAR